MTIFSWWNFPLSPPLFPLFSRIAMDFRSTYRRFAVLARLVRRCWSSEPRSENPETDIVARSRGHVGGRNGIQVSRAWSAPWLHKETGEKRERDWLPRLCDTSREILFSDFAPGNTTRSNTTYFMFILSERHAKFLGCMAGIYSRSSLTISACHSSCRLHSNFETWCLKHLCVRLNIEKFE